jgi:aerobic C4-dicarboxylate transport protein
VVQDPLQVLIAITLGILIGHFYPNTGKALKPLGDGFIALIKMMIAPVISAPWCMASPRWAI